MSGPCRISTKNQALIRGQLPGRDREYPELGVPKISNGKTCD